MKKSFEAKRRNAKIAASRRRRGGTMAVWITLGVLAFIGVTLAFWWSLASDVDSARAAMAADTPSEGIGREVVSETYTPAAATISADVLDYTDGVIWGWDGRYCELWEMDLLSRIFYLEFWGASPECCEAGIDAILRLWESGEFGDSLGGVLTAVNAAGKYVYSTYPAVWTTEYDAEGLTWCRAYCEERFATGPVWIATYFQKYGYPDWGVWSPVPCYCLDGVFFSVARWW